MIRPTRVLYLLCLFALAAVQLHAQVVIGTPPYGSYGGDTDIVNLANLNAHFTIPIFHKPGRGLPFVFDITYDTSVWYPVVSGSTTSWQPVANWGWGGSDYQVGYITYKFKSTTASACGRLGSVTHETWTDWVYHDGAGTPHPFPGTSWETIPSCSATTYGSLNVTALDGSGYQLSVKGGTINLLTNRTGAIINRAPSAGAPGSIQDRNGNFISDDGKGNFTDTLGTVALTITGAAPNPVSYNFANSAGASSSISTSYVNYNIQTAFGCSGINEYSASSVPLVDTISLPNGTSYKFVYENTPGSTTTVTGRLQSITMPTGEKITYTYTGGSSGNITCADGSAAGLTRKTPDGTWVYLRTPGTGTAYTTTITDPQNNDLVIQFQGLYQTVRQVYQGSHTAGTLLQTITNCYNGITTNCPGTGVALPITATQVTNQLDSNGVENEIVSTYNSSGMPKEVDVYGYGAGAVGPLVRKTLYTYPTSLGNITAFRQIIQVTDANNNIVSQTNYNYDETTPTSIQVPQNVKPTTARGNLTSLQMCIVVPACTQYLTAKKTYDTTGQVLTTTDNALNVTTLGYVDGYFVDNVTNPANPPEQLITTTPTNAFLTSISVPLLGVVGTYGYYYYSGKPATFQEVNGANTYSHYDSFDRLTTAYLPALPNGQRGWLLNQYTNVSAVESFVGITSTGPSTSCTSCRHDETNFDSSGRISSMVLVSDPDGATTSALGYDSLGRLQSVSNPYRTTSDPTYGIQSWAFDGLGRTIKTTYPDGSAAQNFYGSTVAQAGGNASQLCSSGTYGLGYPTLTVDPSGRKKESWNDGLGRLIEADEPDSSGNLTLATCYLHDLLDNVVSVVQGSQTRTFTFDPASRLTSSATPEAGTVYFYYTNASGTVCSGNPDLICRRTNARGITATNSYDALNRLTGTTYSDGTPSVSLFYDQSSYNGLSIANGKYRRTGMSDGSGSTAWSYNALGEIVAEQRTIAGVTKSVTYSHNVDGSLASVTYPSGRQIAFSYSNAQRTLSAIDTSTGVKYASKAIYAPHGAPSSVVFGNTASYSGLTETDSYNNRLQLTGQVVTAAGGTTVLNLQYGFPASPANNEDPVSVTNNLVPGRSASLQYDTLNRISAGSSQATTGPSCWGQNFQYDRWGNLQAAGLTQCPGYILNVSVTNNQITSSGFSYDASGNMTNDGNYTYLYDAEGRITSGGGVAYTYDGSGIRVKKSNGKLYWRSVTSFSLEETDLSGNVTDGYVYFNGRLTARLDASNNVFYYFSDRLGSTKLITQSDGSVCYDTDYLPFGAELPVRNSCAPNYKFTGFERDPETGLDYAFLRYYSSRLARFLAPDPVAGTPSQPQSLNRYTYALNNPCAYTDPLGLAPGCTITVAIGGPYSQDILNVITKLLAQANVGVNFNFTPESAQYGMDFTSSPARGMEFPIGYAGFGKVRISPHTYGASADVPMLIDKGNYGWVFVDNISRDLGIAPNVVSDLVTALGVVAAHEIVHEMGLEHYDEKNNLMNRYPLSQKSHGLTKGQIAFILGVCRAGGPAPLVRAGRGVVWDGPTVQWASGEITEPQTSVSTQETDSLPADCASIPGGCSVDSNPGDGSVDLSPPPPIFDPLPVDMPPPPDPPDDLPPNDCGEACGI